MWKTEEIVTEFIFLGNESARNENMLHNIPFRNKVRCIYVDFCKMQKKSSSLLRKNVRAFYPDNALKHFNKYERNRLYKHVHANYCVSTNLRKLFREKAKKELKGKRHQGQRMAEFTMYRPNKS